jgi:hypothetical protein
MALFDKASHPDKPKYLLEREKEQEERIRNALTGLRKTQSTRNPYNMMLQGFRGLSNTTVSRPARGASIGTLMSASPNSGAFGNATLTGGYKP